jgi:Antitoxin SocA-like, Panacea domain
MRYRKIKAVGLVGQRRKLMHFDREKFKKLVVYIAWKAGRRDWFGATKLNKVLWFAEARAFVLHGSPIVGATYIREKHGPVPRQMMPIRDELERAGVIRIFNEGKLVRITADVRPDLSEFTQRELQIIDYWIEHIDKDHTAGTISEESHDYAWDIAHMGEEIPLYAILAQRIRDPDDKELERLKEKARSLGLM